MHHQSSGLSRVTKLLYSTHSGSMSCRKSKYAVTSALLKVDASKMSKQYPLPDTHYGYMTIFPEYIISINSSLLEKQICIGIYDRSEGEYGELNSKNQIILITSCINYPLPFLFKTNVLLGSCWFLLELDKLPFSISSRRCWKMLLWLLANIPCSLVLLFHFQHYPSLPSRFLGWTFSEKNNLDNLSVYLHTVQLDYWLLHFFIWIWRRT